MVQTVAPDTRNVYQRMHAVMREIGYITKVPIQNADGGYFVVTEEAITSALRPALVKHGLVIFPIEHKHTREDERIGGVTNRITTLDVAYRIQNIDDPQDYAIAVSTGTAVDMQDKGIGKAMTYAYKYMALRTFAIETGTDPDHTSSDEYSRDLAAKAASGDYGKVKKPAEVKFYPPKSEQETQEPIDM